MARPWLITSSVVIALASSVGIAVGVAGDQGAQLHTLGGGGQRAESGVGLEHRLVGRAEAGQLIEVIHHEDRVEAGGLGFLSLGDDGGEEFGDAGAVGEVGDLKSESNRHASRNHN